MGEVLSHAMTLTPLTRMCDLILSHHFWPQLSVSMQWDMRSVAWSLNQSDATTPVFNDSVVFWQSDGKTSMKMSTCLAAKLSSLHPPPRPGTHKLATRSADLMMHTRYLYSAVNAVL